MQPRYKEHIVPQEIPCVMGVAVSESAAPQQGITICENEISRGAFDSKFLAYCKTLFISVLALQNLNFVIINKENTIQNCLLLLLGLVKCIC